MIKRYVAASLLMSIAAGASAAPLPRPSAFGVCGACHKTEKGAPNTIGPNLFGIGGTKSGEVPGFAFSAAMKKGEISWTKANLVKFIMAPQATVPGTRMPFGGLKDEKAAGEIADYILSLK